MIVLVNFTFSGTFFDEKSIRMNLFSMVVVNYSRRGVATTLGLWMSVGKKRVYLVICFKRVPLT